ncbi:MAG TPA: hypothetical protein VK796_04490 [Cytophaga sp.]|jgi:hypothetical protein|nr:hypothetical protein [Cytophaga sp.]
MKKLQSKKTGSKRSQKGTQQEDKKPFSDMGIGFRVVEQELLNN